MTPQSGADSDVRHPQVLLPSRLSDDFLDELQRSTDVHRLRWTPCLTPGGREDAEQVREYPVRFTDIDLFDHTNNAVCWSVVEDYLSTRPELLGSPLRVTLEHEVPIAPGDKLEILAHTHPAGSTHRFGAELADRAARTLTYVAGDQTKAIASIFALSPRAPIEHTR